MKLEQFRVLSDDEIEVIHRTALTILSEIGAVVNLPEAVELLAGAGADIDGNRVRISSEIVSEALAKKPKDVVLYDQQGEGIRLGGDRHFHFSGAYNLNVLDYGCDEARPARLDDVVQFTRLADALPEIDGVIPHVLALDQPESSQEQATYRATLENTKKHCLAAPLSFEGAKAWVELGLSASVDPSRPAVSMVVADAPLLQWDS
ncbi:MAG: trimethylamine methyltransferase family protein, partial [Phycisphaerae bacterium]|nr:trimethylamine methyltransferase family protein [Phycisphaerae bacterium]